MSVQFKIRITKEIINQAKNCGTDKYFFNTGNNCAIAIALQNIFPEVHVTNFYIFPFGIDDRNMKSLKIDLPLVAQQFIKLFDGFCFAPNLRLLLPEFEFIADVPDEIINAINIDEVKDLINNKRTSAPANTTYSIA